jgi:hypothetical protein
MRGVGFPAFDGRDDLDNIMLSLHVRFMKWYLSAGLTAQNITLSMCGVSSEL